VFSYGQSQVDRVYEYIQNQEAHHKKQSFRNEYVEFLKKFKIESEAREAQAKEEAEKAKLAKFVTDLKSEKLCTPAMEGLVSELLGPEKKEYSHDKKTYSKQEAIKELLKLSKASADVNFDEDSSHDYKKDSEMDSEEMDAKIKKFAKDNNCSYSAAYKAVMKKDK
jgi:hypothetical protein